MQRSDRGSFREKVFVVKQADADLVQLGQGGFLIGGEVERFMAVRAGRGAANSNADMRIL
jgi:hypothetical protein